METNLDKIIKKAINYVNVKAQNLTQSRKVFTSVLAGHEVRGRYSGVYTWNIAISMSQKEWSSFSVSEFEWSLRTNGLGVEFMSEIDGEKDIKMVQFSIREFYIKKCNR